MKYHEVPYLGRLKPQLGQKGCILAHWVCFWPFSQAGWFHMGCNSAGWAGRSVAMLWTPNKAIFKIKNVPHKIGPWKFRDQGHFGTKGALLGPPGAQKRPDTRSKCVVTMSSTQAGQSGAVGTKSGPPGPSEDLRGPQKGIWGQIGPFYGLCGPRRGPIPGQSVWWPWVQPRLANWGQSGPNLVPRGPPRSPKGAFWA